MYSQKRSQKTLTWVLGYLGLPLSTYYRWRTRQVKGQLADQYKAPINLDVPLAPEIEAVLKYAISHPKEGYRRLSYMMIDDNVAYFSPSTVYRILSDNELLCRWKKSVKSTSPYNFTPTDAHQQWHTDIMYLWVSGRWYFFVGLLDAYSRYIVHWELLEVASAAAVRGVIQTALKKYPGKKPRLVTDNGVQFKGRDFRELIKEFSLKDIKIRLKHPESNGAIERFHRSLREEGLSDRELKTKYNALDIITKWVHYYNNIRLHASLKYLRPVDYLTCRQEELLKERKEKMRLAQRKRREINLQLSKENIVKEQNKGALPPNPQDLPLVAVPA